MILVIDASVAIAWIAEDECSTYADAVLAACGHDRALVPAIWRWEMSNTLVVLERKGRLEDAAATFQTLVRNLPVESVEYSDVRAITEIEQARRHRLSVYDAAYLALAKSEGLLLATLDRALANAAQAEGAYFQG